MGEELYILIDPSTYVYGKSEALKCQISLLNSMKKIHKLRILSRQEQDLRKNLYKLLDSVLVQIDELQKKLPKPEIPESLKKEIEKKFKKIEEQEIQEEVQEEQPKKLKKRKLSFSEAIDEELMKIQEKLKLLNG